MPGRKRYCVFGCAELGAYMHCFPHPERKSELFKTWVSIVGDKLKYTDPLKIYKNKRICDHHFRPDQKVACHRLIYMAVPSVNLTGLSLSPRVSSQLEHNYCLPTIYEEFDSSSKLNLKVSSQTTTDGTEHEALNERLHSIDQPSTSKLNSFEALNERLHSIGQPSTSEINSSDGLKSSEHIHKKYKTAQKEIRKLRTRLSKSVKKQKSFEARLAKATSLLEGNDSFERVTKNMTRSGKIFTGIQYRQALKKPKGRRYTTEEKILALSIYKKSPKCYSLLYKYFRLPSAKSLKNLLGDINISPGINDKIFEKLKETVDSLNAEDRLCTLIFDEMSLTPNVLYNSGSDELKGFISHSETLKIANHALVFMIKGVKKNFKQPVAYHFTQSLKTEELKKMIKDVIRHVQKTGLTIICTVCDQGAANRSAINSLVRDTREKYLKNGKEWRQDIFEIDGRKIIPIYDVPHLLKGLRNNLLNKDLKYRDQNKEKIMKWNFLEMLYEADKTRGELRCLHKLTEEHIRPSKIKKMRVKMAAQIFSHSVAVTTDHFISRGLLPEECRQLIQPILLIDKLFDSLNAGSFHIPNGKTYRGAVRKNSPHHKIWVDAISFFKSVKFISKKKVGDKVRFVESSIPSTINFIKTIEGMQAIWKILNQKYLFDCMLTRNFNQDPVENFFGSIRSLGVRNISPNSSAFEGAFKTLLLNNFSSHHAVNANCEEDFNICLQTLDFFFKEKDKLVGSQPKNLQIEISDELYAALSNAPAGDTPSQARYVCGWVVTKCLKKIVKTCKECKQALMSNNSNCYIGAKEYNINKPGLCYPSHRIEICFREIQEITVKYLKTNLTQRNLRENIMYLTNAFVTFPFSCNDHNESLQVYFTKTTINILIFSWCRSINRILSGKMTNDDPDDPIKRSAEIYYLTHRNQK